MLVLTRKAGQRIYILDGSGNEIVVVYIDGGPQGRIGIVAPPHYRIYREEIMAQIEAENKVAAEGVVVESTKELQGISRKFKFLKADTGKKR